MVAPKELRVWIILSISVIALLISAFALLPSFAPTQEASSAEMPPQAISPGANPVAVQAPGPAAPMMVKNAGTENVSATDNGSGPVNSAQGPLAGAESATPTAAASLAQDERIPMLVGGLSALSIAACLAILVRNRMKASST